MSISLRRSDVPEYLLDSYFYRNLSEGDDDTFCIDHEHFKVDCSIVHFKDLRCLLSTMRFWGTITVPKELYEYLLSNWSEDCEHIISQFLKELTFLNDVVVVAKAPHEQRANKALHAGDMSLIRYVICGGYPFDEVTSKIAASLGNVEILMDLHRLGCSIMPDAITAAASAGHLNCLECLKKLEYLAVCNNSTHFAGEALLAAAENGHADCLRFLYAHERPPLQLSWEVCHRAAVHGRAACLRFAVEDSGRNAPMYLETVAESGDLECLQYVHSAAGNWDPWSSTAILHGNNVACVEYALRTGCEFRDVDLKDAVRLCDLSIVKLLYEQGLWPGGPELTRTAATLNRLDCLQYLHEAGCAWDAQTCRAAAGYACDNLQCLQYAHEHGCPWDAGACEIAAANNRINCLQYLHENGCPWNEFTIEEAMRNSSTECLAYAQLHGCPKFSRYQKMKRNAKAVLKQMFAPKEAEPEYLFDITQYVP